MNVHKSLRYLLVGGFALTSLIAYGNNETEQTAKSKAKVSVPGHIAKIAQIAGICLLGGAFDTYTQGTSLVGHFKSSNELHEMHENDKLYFTTLKNELVKKLPKGKIAGKLVPVIPCLINGLAYLPGAIAVIYDMPKKLTHKISAGHTNKHGKEVHDSRSTFRDISVFVGARLAFGLAGKKASTFQLSGSVGNQG